MCLNRQNYTGAIDELALCAWDPGRYGKCDCRCWDRSTKDAAKFYTAKVDELQTNLKDLESIVQGKSNNLRVVEDVLRQKVLSGNAGAPAAE
ncbi:hypothetical protein V498_04886 [Pseudogymnoascus sp. VKM F-4517 (FW-2822)]|nr:hypothetical protein V498_04886 [Pseudogymnoascus sp. VKM F-4517 (FW-2822)]